MPISTTINDVTSMLALMNTSDPVDLAQDYTITSDIDMGNVICNSIGITDPSGFTGSITGLQGTCGKPVRVIIRNVNTPYDGFISYVNTNKTIQNILIEYPTGGLDIISYNDVGGFVGAVDGSANIINCGVILGNNIGISTNATNAGGFVGIIINGHVDNCYIYAGVQLELEGINIGGFVGNIRYTLINKGRLSNSSVILGKDCQLGGGANTSIVGGICGHAANISNCKLIIDDNCTYSVSNVSSKIGGLFGYIDTLFNIEHSIINCYGIYGNNTNISTSILNTDIGGVCGECTGNVILCNCIVIFGNNTILNSTFYRVGGVIGTVTLGATVQNCISIFKDYNISGVNNVISGPLIGVGTGTNILSQTYGVALPGSIVNNVSTTSQSDIYNTILTFSSDIHWLIPLIRIREPASNPLPGNTVNLDSIFIVGDDKELQYFKNTAILLSMNYSSTTFINSTFGTIKRYLNSYTTIPDSTNIIYLAPNNNIFFVYQHNNYYLPLDNINITIINNGKQINNITTCLTYANYNMNTYVINDTIETYIQIIGIGTLCIYVLPDIQEKQNICIVKSQTTNLDDSIIAYNNASCNIRTNANNYMKYPQLQLQRGIKKAIFSSYQFQMQYLQGKC